MRRLAILLVFSVGCSIFAPTPPIQKATSHAMNARTAWDLIYQERCLGQDVAATPWSLAKCHDTKLALDSLGRAINAAKNPDPKAGSPLSIGGQAPEMIKLLDDRRRSAAKVIGESNGRSNP